MPAELSPRQRLAEEIRQEYERLRSYKKLGEATRVDRRKLKRIAEGEDVALTFEELAGLDAHLSGRGRGLAALFSPRGVVRQIAERGNTLFVLGSRPDERHRRIDFSRWDIRALREVLQAMNATGRPVAFTLEDVIVRTEAEKHFGPERQGPVDEREAWYHCLNDDGQSVVCIGSPKACHASEVMLARMVGVEEFRPPDTEGATPFSFFWPDDDWRATGSRSAFVRRSHDLAGVPGSETLRRALQTPESRACAIDDGELRPVYREGREWETMAVIAAQRRPRDQIWLVLAGLTGPGTLGAAIALRDFVAEIPPLEETGCSRLVWTTVRVHVEDKEDTGFRKDERRVTGEPVLEPVRFWPEEG